MARHSCSNAGCRRSLERVWFLALVFSLSCAGGNAARQPCPAEAWVGKCKRRDLRKVEERELPIPYVVYEAIYSPQANGNYPNFTPPEVRYRFGTPAHNEFALLDHLTPQSEVDCRAPSIEGSCQPREVVADVVPFDPDRAPARPLPRTTGCAAIDAASEQDRLAKSASTRGTISERFTFAQDSAELASDASASAQAIVKRMAEDPQLECLGLVGENSPGESMSLAEARARAVKRLLVSLGADPKKILTLAATAHVVGAGAEPQRIEPDTRRVTASVLLETQPEAGP